MIVEIAIPELTLYPDDFPSRWLGIIFLGNRRGAYKIHAIITTYIRLVEGAYVHYKNAPQRVQAFWNNHASVDMFSYNLSATWPVAMPRAPAEAPTYWGATVEGFPHGSASHSAP
ncbi:MAG: hypothetical protein WA624_22075 [Methylocella sp.]